MQLPTVFTVLTLAFSATTAIPTLLQHRQNINPLCTRDQSFRYLRCCKRSTIRDTYDCTRLDPEPVTTIEAEDTCRAIAVPNADQGTLSSKRARCCIELSETGNIACGPLKQIEEDEEEPTPTIAAWEPTESATPIEAPDPEEPGEEEEEDEEEEDEGEDAGLSGLVGGLMSGVGSTVGDTVKGTGGLLGGILS